jgi:hypothetical protein
MMGQHASSPALVGHKAEVLLALSLLLAGCAPSPSGGTSTTSE